MNESQLSPREIDVIRAIDDKRSIQKIAKLLNLDETTVRHTIGNVCEKLSIDSRRGLMEWAKEHYPDELAPTSAGLISPKTGSILSGRPKNCP